MKTIAKSLIAISVLMISLQALAAKDQVSKMISSNTITYKVLVHMPDGTASALRNVYVVVADETGRLIAPAQLLIPGKSEYTFSEAGPVKGTRVARLSNGLRPHSGSFISIVDSQTGIFNGGSTYLFNLYIAFPTSNQGIE